ncbi:SCO family protein [Rivihabitans pingtungensis]|uniref:Protein SCO1/2 n=2 Tax=Rivihabitans pingtungensis TaxID=1054498 RepID=A0A318KUW7_9NEIS|nr:SCO family protein [Rivihabitans pingtungensis]PXX79416.1 protein SCO1/2 [Rivihabitans pingtungensis]
MPLPFARLLTHVCIAAALACPLPACSPTPPSPPAVAFQGRDISGSLTLQDFTLTDHNGQPRKLSEFRGKPVAVYFGYTHCPDVCPTTLAELAQSMRELGPQADQVQVLFITIDPARDTQALLKSYAPAFDPRFIGLTGSPAQIASVAGQFRALYRRQDGANGDYTMDHSAGAYLLDRDGKLRVEVPYGSGAATFTHDLRALLQ